MNRYLLRAQRARALAGRVPHAAEALLLFAQVSERQALGAADYRDLAPQAPDTWEERIRAERHPPQAPPSRADNECPRCGELPQLGILRQQGDGDALNLACSVCRTEWPFPRTTCPACGDTEHLEFYRSEQLPHLQTLVCTACKTYLHILEPNKELACIPEADEIAAQALDAWALEQGYQKLTPNLAGV